MTRKDFQKLVRTEFGFLRENNFDEISEIDNDDCVTYYRERLMLEIKWEDYGTYICGYIEREDLPGRFDLNAFIRILLPSQYREIRPGNFPDNFSCEHVIQYMAHCLQIILEDFWNGREELWAILEQQLEEARRKNGSRG